MAYCYPEKKKDTCLILHDAVTPLTTLLVSEIKMAAQILRSKVSDVLWGFFSGKSPKMTLRLGKCLIKVRIHCVFYLNLAFFFTNYVIFFKLCDRMQFEVNCAKSHHRVISDGLQNAVIHKTYCSMDVIFFWRSNCMKKTSVYIHKLRWKERQLFKASLQRGTFVKNLEFILNV